MSGRSLFILLNEMKRKGRLVSKVPRAIRHCVSQVYAKSPGGREELSRAFAICTATMQKAGQVKPGTQDATKKGHRAHEYSKAKDTEYERILKAVKK